VLLITSRLHACAHACLHACLHPCMHACRLHQQQPITSVVAPGTEVTHVVLRQEGGVHGGGDIEERVAHHED